jgi:hypothetical protein
VLNLLHQQLQGALANLAETVDVIRQDLFVFVGAVDRNVSPIDQLDRVYQSAFGGWEKAPLIQRLLLLSSLCRAQGIGSFGLDALPELLNSGAGDSKKECPKIFERGGANRTARGR